MLLTLFLEIILSIFTLYGIFMLIYKYVLPTYKKCKAQEKDSQEHMTKEKTEKGEAENGKSE